MIASLCDHVWLRPFVQDGTIWRQCEKCLKQQELEIRTQESATGGVHYYLGVKSDDHART